MRKRYCVKIARRISTQQRSLDGLSVLILSVVFLVIPLFYGLLRVGDYHISELNSNIGCDMSQIGAVAAKYVLTSEDGIIDTVSPDSLLEKGTIAGIGDCMPQMHGNLLDEISGLFPILEEKIEQIAEKEHLDDSEGLGQTLSASLWNYNRISLRAGETPSAYMLSHSDMAKELEPTFLLYLGDSYRDSIPVGTEQTRVYYSLDANTGERTSYTVRYIIAGYFQKDQRLLTSSWADDTFSNGTFLNANDSVILVPCRKKVQMDGTFYILLNEEASHEEVYSDLSFELQKNGFQVNEIIWMDEHYSEYRQETERTAAKIKRMLYILEIMAVVQITVVQIILILVCKKDLGTWYSVGAGRSDIFRIILYKNLLRFIIPVILGTIGGIAICSMLVSGGAAFEFGLFFKWVFPRLLLFSVVSIGLSTVIPMALLAGETPIDMLQGD